MLPSVEWRCPFLINRLWNKQIESESVSSSPPFSASSTKLVCHMTNWAQYRQSSAQFKPENIDPFLWTHIIYALASIDNFNQIRPIEWNDE